MTSVKLGMPAAPPPVIAPRRKTRQFKVGSVGIGSDSPISVQTMTTTKTHDINATLQQIAELIAAGRGDEVMYTSPAGPITPLDMLFGHQASLARGNIYMAHRTGYTPERLRKVLAEAGFADVRVMRGNAFDLWAVAVSARTTTG